MNSDTRGDLLKERRQLSKDIEKLNKVKVEKLDYQTGVRINNLLKMKKQKYKIISAMIGGGSYDGRRKKDR